MEKNKEDGMTDLEIIKQEVDFLDKYMADHELDERFEAILTSATRMAAEIERLKAALAEKPDIVRCGECFDFNSCKCPLATCCNSVYQSPDKNFYCPYGTRKEAKMRIKFEVICGREEE